MTEHKGLLAAILAVQSEVPTLVKNSTAKAGSFTYKYVDLADVIENVRPLLVKNGLVWSTFPTRDEQGDPALRYRLSHAASGESEQDVMPLMIQKADPQGQGSAITYARRYALIAVLDLIADVDDDGHAAAGAPQQKAAPTSTAADVNELAAAAKGLTVAQLKGALASVGVTAPVNWADPFRRIPKEKVARLAQKLAAIERVA